MKFSNIVAGIVLITTIGCDGSYDVPIIDDGFKGIKVPEGFDFATTREVDLSITVRNAYQVLSGVPVTVYLDHPITGDSLNPDARKLKTLSSDLHGVIETKIVIPIAASELFLYTEFIGLEQIARVEVVGGSVNYTFGGSAASPLAFENRTDKSRFKSSSFYTYMGGWNSIGKPDYLEAKNDVISAALLNDINTSLPEKSPVTTSHPSYLATGNETDVQLDAEADVWITFVHEGAGYLNSLGYYTYPAGTILTSISQIQKHIIIFPTVDYVRYGGGLESGNKVFLGRFPAGTALGWFLVQGGYTNGIVEKKLTFYSEPALNPETKPEIRQHTVLLNDPNRKILLLGFEDLSRQGYCDNDFNDAVFYVTANPPTAVNTGNIPLIDSPNDRDKDGVFDNYDKYPDDITKAYNHFYPAEGQFGTLVAEDLWPAYGDFDFNDLVTDYQFHTVIDAQNRVVEMNIKVKVRAIGASFANGLGFELPVAPSAIASVSGQVVPDGLFPLSANGTEKGQSKAVIIAFENAYDLLPHPGGGTGVNVVPGSTWVVPKEITVRVTFTAPVPEKSISNAPYNPFLIINGTRGKEIHLASYPPTSLADVTLFGLNKDHTVPASGKYYVSEDNFPWMLNIPLSFQYSIEKGDLEKAYTHFRSWASSGGSLYPDWYNPSEGYQNKERIYK